jgi:hypothetical protein
MASTGGRGGAAKKVADAILTCRFEVLLEMGVNYVLSNTDLPQYYEKRRQLAAQIATLAHA